MDNIVQAYHSESKTQYAAPECIIDGNTAWFRRADRKHECNQKAMPGKSALGRVGGSDNG